MCGTHKVYGVQCLYSSWCSGRVFCQGAAEKYIRLEEGPVYMAGTWHSQGRIEYEEGVVIFVKLC